MITKLEEIGFKKVGCWRNLNGKLSYKIECEDSGRSVNGLYCFIVQGELKYIGIAKTTLRSRMKIYADNNTGYQIKWNKKNLIKEVNEAKDPHIYFMSNSDFLYLELYPIDMAEGLIVVA